MRRLPFHVIVLVLAASAPAQQLGEPLEQELRQARSEQARAELEAARLDKAAARARDEAGKLRAAQAAAAQAMEAAEARISAANIQLRLASAYVAAHRLQLAREQRPVSSLLAGLAIMGQRPPLLALADKGGVDELVRVQILLDSTLPEIRRRTAAISAEIDEAKRLEISALAARQELELSRRALATRKQEFANLEQQAINQALVAGGQALSAGDAAIAAGETIERVESAGASRRRIRELAAFAAAEVPPPPRPSRPQGTAPTAQIEYRLPSLAPVVEGLGAVSDTGIRSRGLTLATVRGDLVTAPANGTIKFAGPFRDYDGVVIVDHGGGWLSLIVNMSPDLRTGSRVRQGQPLGRALGPLLVELSHNGRRYSPALIAGSSEILSKGAKGG